MGVDGAQGASAADEVDMDAVRARMAVIKEEVAAEVERKWVTPYRNPEVFDTKVNARLASHPEYRALQDQVRKAHVAEVNAAKDAARE